MSRIRLSSFLAMAALLVSTAAAAGPRSARTTATAPVGLAPSERVDILRAHADAVLVQPDPLPVQEAAADIGLSADAVLAIIDARMAEAAAKAQSAPTTATAPPESALPASDRLVASLERMSTTMEEQAAFSRFEARLADKQALIDALRDDVRSLQGRGLAAPAYTPGTDALAAIRAEAEASRAATQEAIAALGARMGPDPAVLARIEELASSQAALAALLAPAETDDAVEPEPDPLQQRLEELAAAQKTLMERLLAPPAAAPAPTAAPVADVDDDDAPLSVQEAIAQVLAEREALEARLTATDAAGAAIPPDDDVVTALARIAALEKQLTEADRAGDPRDDRYRTHRDGYDRYDPRSDRYDPRADRYSYDRDDPRADRPPGERDGRWGADERAAPESGRQTRRERLLEAPPDEDESPTVSQRRRRLEWRAGVRRDERGADGRDDAGVDEDALVARIVGAMDDRERARKTEDEIAALRAELAAAKAAPDAPAAPTSTRVVTSSDPRLDQLLQAVEQIRREQLELEDRVRQAPTEAERALLADQADAAGQRADALTTELTSLRATLADREASDLARRAPLENAEARLKAAGLSATIDGQAVRVQLASDSLFGSGAAKLSVPGRTQVTQVAATLRSLGDAVIEVEGHTDDVPIRTARFTSNYDLASARATEVIDVLATAGVPRAQMRAVSYGDARPVQPNTTPEGRAANRRIEILVIPSAMSL